MRNSRAKELTMEVLVGGFMFVVLLVLGVFTIILSKENFFKKYDQVTVRFDDVKGLRPGAVVMVRGLEVGQVKQLTLQPDGVHVKMSLSEHVALREGYKVEVVPISMLGGRQLSIFEGP
ncbi:MAG: MlaD family protein, partial [Verrucomicrobiota bacterium]